MSASDHNALIKTRAMCDFPVDAESLAEQPIAWVMEGAEQLKSVISEIVKAARSADSR